MTSTRISDLLVGIGAPEGVRPARPVPFEQTEEYREMRRGILESRLHKAGLFGDYMTADSELGARVCQIVSEGRGAYLWGLTGRGKTYAAAQAVRVAVETRTNVRNPAKLITAKELMDAVKSGFNGGDDDVLARCERYPLLVLDDLGAEAVRGFSIETITGLVDKRVARGLVTVVTSNYSVGQLRELWGGMAGARIASRLAGACERIEVTGPDRRLR